MVNKPKAIASATTITARRNSPGLVPPTEQLILKEAQQAFTDNATSQTLSGSATQRLAYAIMCHHAAMVEADAKLATLSRIGASPEASANLRRDVTAYFLGKMPNDDGLSNDQVADNKAQRTAKNALLNRAFKLALTLAERNVTWIAFDTRIGVFSVPSAMLVKKGDIALGRLNTDKTVLLDNRPAAVNTKAKNGEDRMLSIRASVSQLIDATTPTKRTAPQSRESNVEALVKELHGIVTKDSASVPSLPVAVWNMLTEIAVWADTNQPKFGAPAKPNGNPATDGKTKVA